MLEVGAEALGLESSPGGDLVRAAGLGRPLWEAVCIRGELVLEALGGWAVGEEEDLWVVLVIN
jgi:hypothetical protein